MGVFASAAVWRDMDEAWNRRAADAVAAAAKDPEFAVRPEKCAIEHCRGGVAVWFNEDCPCDEKLAEFLSKELGGAVLVCGIYDSDFWDYYLFDKGIEKDRFCTIPDYFEEMDKRELRRWKGSAVLLRRYFKCSWKIAAYLHFWKEDTRGKKACRDDEYVNGDCWQLCDFLHTLGFDLPSLPEPQASEEESMTDQAAQQDVRESAAVPSAQLVEDAGDERRRRLQEEDEIYAHLPEHLTPDIGRVDNVRVWRGDEVQIFENERLTSEKIARMVEDVLAGEYTRLAIDFLLYGEGVYVKRLKKTVYSSFISTLVVHNVDGRLACVFFCGDTKHCYALISDYHTYCTVDTDEVKQIQLGEAILPEYVVHQDRELLDQALRYLFLDAAKIDERLYNSKRWSSENIFLQGSSKYAELRRTWGALKE